MSERINQSPEHEVKPEKQDVAHEKQRERIAEQLERRAEQSNEKADVEKATHEALESAKKAEKLNETKHETATVEKKRKAPKRTKKTLDISFDKQMKDVRHDMPAPSRAFSKVIHNKSIEKVSGAVGSTVARPNAILSGSVTAFILVLGVYLLARYVGYPLSGFEVIGAFIVGWLVGIIFDFLRIMITGKQ